MIVVRIRAFTHDCTANIAFVIAVGVGAFTYDCTADIAFVIAVGVGTFAHNRLAEIAQMIVIRIRAYAEHFSAVIAKMVVIPISVTANNSERTVDLFRDISVTCLTDITNALIENICKQKIRCRSVSVNGLCIGNIHENHIFIRASMEKGVRKHGRAEDFTRIKRSTFDRDVNRRDRLVNIVDARLNLCNLRVDVIYSVSKCAENSASLGNRNSERSERFLQNGIRFLICRSGKLCNPCFHIGNFFLNPIVSSEFFEKIMNGAEDFLCRCRVFLSDEHCKSCFGNINLAEVSPVGFDIVVNCGNTRFHRIKYGIYGILIRIGIENIR